MRLFNNIKLPVQVIGLICAFAVLSGCASRYPEELRTDQTELVEFSQAFTESQAHIGTPARWGGLIAEVTNLSESSVIEVVQFELNGYGRPHITEESPGRFRIRVAGFVDPEIYKKGREVTAFGLYSGLEPGHIGEYEYMFPMLESEGLHLWQERPERSRVDVIFHHPYPAYRFRFWGPYPYFPAVGNEGDNRPPLQQGPREQGQRESGGPQQNK